MNVSLNVRPAYGVSEGPCSVPVQCRRLAGLVGKAEMERSFESMRVISSDWRLCCRVSLASTASQDVALRGEM